MPGAFIECKMINLKSIFKELHSSFEYLDEIPILKLTLEMQKWSGKPIEDTYGNKAILAYKQQPYFAELIIVKILQENDINAVWVDTFRKKFRQELPEKSKGITLPLYIQERFDEITKVNKTRNGCWDILAWDKNHKLAFIELKERKKDKIRSTQINWLKSCLSLKYDIDQFSIIEWSKN